MARIKKRAEIGGEAAEGTLRPVIRSAAMQLYASEGLRFTMQQVAQSIHISKKTIYAVYPSKEALLLDLVDAAFEAIHRRKRALMAGEGSVVERLRRVIIALPEEYTTLDLRRMQQLDAKYPAVADRVRWHLETGWEPTLALLRQGVSEGVIRDVSLSVLQTMITASIEAFLYERTAEKSRLSYPEMLDEMISILLEGLVIR